MNDFLDHIENQNFCEEAESAAQFGLVSLVISGLIYCIALLA